VKTLSVVIGSPFPGELFPKNMKYFDTHAHLNFPDYNKDRDEVIKKSLEKGFFIINIGTDLKESKKVVEIAKNYRKGIYASVGLHPLYIEREEDFALDSYRKLAKEEKVVAIGETGLDYKYISEKRKEEFEEEKNLQKEVFRKHIKIAREFDLPVVLHCRKAHKDLIEELFNLIKEEKQNIKGVVHCFTGSISQAKEYIDLGFYLGINGVVFKMNLEKVIKEIPLVKMVIETDCPFLSPPQVKCKRNEPLFLEYIAKEITRIKKIDAKEVIETTNKNAQNLFL